MNHSQRNLKKLIRAKEDSIADEELFLSAAYQKYQTSLARAVTGRYRYGLQVLLDWDISEQAGVAYTDNYKAVSYTHLTLPTIYSVLISGGAVSLKKKRISIDYKSAMIIISN